MISQIIAITRSQWANTLALAKQRADDPSDPQCLRVKTKGDTLTISFVPRSTGQGDVELDPATLSSYKTPVVTL